MVDINLQQQLICSYPKIFTRKSGVRPDRARIECGDGWYGVVDQCAHDLQVLATKTGMMIYVPSVGSRLGALRIRWESSHQLLSCEHEAISRLQIRFSMLSRTMCEVCGRSLRLIDPLQARCRFHDLHE